MLFDRILIPLDGSEIAEAILGQVCRLLRRKDADVILFQAATVPAQAGLEYGDLIASLKQEAEKYISSLTRQLVKEGVRARGIVKVGTEAGTILDVAEQEKATLIAMATHGRSGMPRFVFGSVAEKVLRASPVPVLVIRSFKEVGTKSKRAPVQEIPFEKILVPVDGSENSLRVIPHVKEFAKAYGASVMVLGIVDPQSEGSKKKGAGEPLVRLAVKDFGDAAIPVDPVVRLGDPAVEILDAAKRHDADLIAMTTHGRSGVSRWVMGSVAEKVLRASTVPMLIVRSKK